MWKPDISQVITSDMQETKSRTNYINSVKSEARRRIEDKWPIWKQINIKIEDNLLFEEMREEINFIRNRSNEIEEMENILDVSDDNLWKKD